MAHWDYGSAMWEIIDQANKHFDIKEDGPEHAEFGSAHFQPTVFYDCEKDDVYYKLSSGRPVTGRVVYPGGYEAGFSATRDEVEWLAVAFVGSFAKAREQAKPV